ncbi:MAG: ribonuclease H-like domain-containing protein, partial [Nannocystaceae bacterium]|nr:ribonuclease H-like domain-containing protein [Nannocystaceae bacterium]
MSLARRLAALPPGACARLPAAATESAQLRHAVYEAPPRDEAGRTPAATDLREALAQLGRVDVAQPPCLLDVETTGLGHDAVPFLVGLAWPRDGRVHVRQYQLDDPAGERAMWLEVLATLTREATGALVTFNGGSFDLVLVRVRLRRLGLASDDLTARIAHARLELLPRARALLRHAVPDVRLATLERRVLGLSRRDDPSGEAVARCGRAWLGGDRSASSRAAVAAARRHNEDDLLGLASLAIVLASRLAAPPDLDSALAAARVRIAQRRHDAAAALLHAALQRWPLRVGMAARLDAAVLLASLQRRAGQADSAASLLHAVVALAPDHDAAIAALAKDCEHRLARPDLALQWAQRQAPPCPRRIARLQRKLARQAAGPQAAD